LLKLNILFEKNIYHIPECRKLWTLGARACFPTLWLRYCHWQLTGWNVHLLVPCPVLQWTSDCLSVLVKCIQLIKGYSLCNLCILEKMPPIDSAV